LRHGFSRIQSADASNHHDGENQPPRAARTHSYQADPLTQARVSDYASLKPVTLLATQSVAEVRVGWTLARQEVITKATPSLMQTARPLA
jgi:hypothetical protein